MPRIDPIGRLTNTVNQVEAKVDQIQRTVTALPQTISDQANKTRTSVSQVAESVLDIPHSLVVKVRESAKPWLLDPFTEALREIFEKMTTPLRDLLSPVLELLHLARLLKDEVLEVEQRLDYVTNTLRFLFPGAGKQLEEIRDAFKALLEPGDAATDLLRLVKAILELNPTVRTVEWITVCALKRELILPDRPAGFYPGRLYEFLHADDLSAGEREFRLELLGALDGYFRGAPVAAPAPRAGRAPGVVSGVDGKLAVKSLTDLVGIVIQTTLGFVFRPPHLASRLAPPMSLLRTPADPGEALAQDASITMSRSVSQPLHALGGLIFRGGWEVNTFNEALVEVVTGGLKSLVASLAESILRSLLSLVEIREVYADPATGERGAEHIWSWQTRSPLGGDSQVVWLEVVLGPGVPDLPQGTRARLAEKLRNQIEGRTAAGTKLAANEANHLLENVLRDFATYRELALLLREPDLDNGAIDVKVMPVSGGLEVEARFKEPQADPKVVVRAFAGGRVEIMRPPEDGVYRARFDDVTPALEVHVLAGLTLHGSAGLAA